MLRAQVFGLGAREKWRRAIWSKRHCPDPLQHPPWLHGHHPTGWSGTWSGSLAQQSPSQLAKLVTLEEQQPFAFQLPGTRSFLTALLSVLALLHFLDKLLRVFFRSLSLTGTGGLATLSLHLPQLEF